MTYSLFIDDERWPSDVIWADWYGTKTQWVIARNWSEVETLIESLGMPNFISFDHDLGPADVSIDGYQIAQNLVEWSMDGKIEFPIGFEFYVHSMNSIGKKNIEHLLNNYLKHQMTRLM